MVSVPAKEPCLPWYSAPAARISGRHVTSATILSIDLERFNSVLRWYESLNRAAAFGTVDDAGGAASPTPLGLDHARRDGTGDVGRHPGNLDPRPGGVSPRSGQRSSLRFLHAP